MKKLFQSIVSNNVSSLYVRRLGDNLFNIAKNTLDLEQAISISSIIWPEIIEFDKFIFLHHNYLLNKNININTLLEKLGDVSKVEKNINTISIDNIFRGDQLSAMNGYGYLDQEIGINIKELREHFSKVLTKFWRLRLSELFPHKEFEIVTAMNLEGEEGLCITFYQK